MENQQLRQNLNNEINKGKLLESEYKSKFADSDQIQRLKTQIQQLKDKNLELNDLCQQLRTEKSQLETRFKDVSTLCCLLPRTNCIFFNHSNSTTLRRRDR